MLHSMMSVLPNGGRSFSISVTKLSAALDDVSATEWRRGRVECGDAADGAALDDVSATEWRLSRCRRAVGCAWCCTR